ncbi:zinc ribbon domain-containing protein [Aromatoleum anaerobium]|uniref:RanBP2-type domain-containing protein n=1 Tax=Aromatoleum anaerobium TaxID=182180 RepID=A0ABX1PPJ3_9RHOO|nr:zinc ribbon domain-containing protein [Aromatoleum anaerobium]MCK0507323.1 zinc ribbon domain-containing protein [Aromatoleum anaerobium]
MDTLQCSFCSHENPATAKFCNACGSLLNLQLCKHCGAIDHASATACYKCGASFATGDEASMRPGATGDETADTAMNPGFPHQPARPQASRSMKPADDPGERLSSPWTRALAVVIFVIGAAILYRIYSTGGESTSVAPDAALPSTAPVDATLRAVPPSSAPADAGAVSIAPPPLAPGSATNEEALAAEPAPPAARTEPSAPADNARAPPYPCTPAVAALGLCN